MNSAMMGKGGAFRPPSPAGLGARLGVGEIGGNLRRSLLSLLSVALGVATLLVLRSLTSGAREQTLEELRRMGGTDVIEVATKEAISQEEELAFSRSAGLTLEEVDRVVARVPEIEQAFVEGQHSDRMVQGPNGARRSRVLGVNWDYFSQFNVPLGDLTRGEGALRASFEAGLPVCLLGSSLAERLFGRPSHALGKEVVYAGRRLEVVGLVTGSSRFDWRSRMAYYPFALYGKAFALPGQTLQSLRLKVKEGASPEAVAQKIREEWRREHRGVEDFSVVTPEQALNDAQEAASLMAWVGGVIALMALGVGGIGILNLMLATVASRIREIGVRKSLGASQACILAQFLTEAATISVVGALLGVGLGTAPLLLPPGLLPVSPTLGTGEIVGAGLLGALTGLLAGWYPAFRASRYSPVEALRHG